MISYDYYRIFYYVASSGSFTNAAKLLNNSQPNITRCISNLEAQLGCRLFIRTRGGVTLTSAGKELYRHVSAAVVQLDAGEAAVNSEIGLKSGMVTITATDAGMWLILLPAITEFRKKYPKIRFRITSMNTPPAIDQVEMGMADFAVVTDPLSLPKTCRSTVLSDMKERLYGTEEIRKTAGKETSLLQLMNQFPLITMNTGSSTREYYELFFLKHHIPFRPAMEASSLEQVGAAIAAGLGIGFLPEKLAEEARYPGTLQEIPIRETLPIRKLNLIESGSRILPPAALAVISLLKNR